ncbi:MAG: peptidylprolyl isomerase [Candidatus Izemoplasmatales bacterium]|jgi:peptidyl-prolyl cis-trans isomerase B (cyclophilin B)|nr:peptidylprolyl isomerase [Candidatus Izemoplasmatales bacterium]MDD4070211.1 peptidylprolyl isomerase [Candidatus Izemoplasmatales bacterium]MDY0139032.1 peptidylprolyl isomerase [Candidatus Izemoplasmatales bacterium]
MNNPIVKILLNNKKTISIELYPNIAMNTVNNFISLISKNFYDSTIFHRVISGFMIQGGDPEGTGMGGPGYSIPGEFISNGYKNDLKHESGVISMARSQSPNSAGSQFFIMHKNAPHLDGLYAAFGKVIEGFEEVERIANVETNYMDKPLEDIVMEKVTVELNGYDYAEPKKN